MGARAAMRGGPVSGPAPAWSDRYFGCRMKSPFLSTW